MGLPGSSAMQITATLRQLGIVVMKWAMREGSGGEGAGRSDCCPSPCYHCQPLNTTTAVIAAINRTKTTFSPFINTAIHATNILT